MTKFAESLQQALNEAHIDAAHSEDVKAELQDLEQCLQALATCVEEFGESHPETATALNNVGTACLALEDHEQALEYYQRALAIRQQVFGEHHPDTAASLSNIGGAYYDMDDKQHALEYGERALTILRETLGEGHPDTVQVLTNLCILLEDLNKTMRAFMLVQDFLRKIPQDNGCYLELAKLRNDLRPPGFRAQHGNGNNKKKKGRR